MKAHPNGFMTQEVKELIDRAEQVLQDGKEELAYRRSLPPAFRAGQREVKGTITVLKRTLEDLNRFAETCEKKVNSHV